MRYILLFLLGLFAFQAFGQQSKEISIRENFFNNYIYSQNGKKIKSEEVKLAMTNYPETLKKYLTGQRNMTVGSGMNVATSVLLTAGTIFFIADNYSIRSRNVFLATSTTGVIMGFIAPGIREEGKRNVSDAIQEYNYQIHRNLGLPPNQISLEVRNPYVVGWKFNF
jgi:hypothetical protein